jgi:predicted molibdopterin-dependent oxidoreductase YjgC
MPKLTVDGKDIEVAAGATVMDAANRLGVYVPHFCYHRKLTIAANCRMCLVEVEKAPKPLPACATPATEGMKVWTHSLNAKKAQNGVMEFLLINHPLDCRSATRAANAGCRTSPWATATAAPATRKACGVEKARPAGRGGGDEPLHPVHALRPLQPGDRRDRSSASSAAARTPRSCRSWARRSTPSSRAT